MTKIKVTETILRDAHQSLIATRMRLEDMLPICERLDKVGYWSLEMWGGATFDACVRFLKEDPWERLRKLREALPNTQLQMLLRGQNLLGYRHYADDVVKNFVARTADNGMDIFRIFDAMNDVRNIRVSVEAVKKAKKHAQGAICYTTSPKHSLQYFVELAKSMEDMGCDSIAVKDMAGLLTPDNTAKLVKSLISETKLPVFIHSHATSGLSSMCQYKAIENGASGIDTAISSFSGGTSHPPTESMVAALANTKYDTTLDLSLLQEIGFYFREIRKKYHQFESEFTGLDTRVQVNQVPGGMISNLSNQLKEQGELSKMNEVLEEIPRVRKELGYPPLVTPTSQIVGTQSVLNVLSDKRYKTITNEVKLYMQGRYGKALGKISPQVQHMAIGNEAIIECRPADLIPNEFKKLKSEIKGTAKSDEDVLTYAMFPELGREFLEQRESGTLTPESLEPPGVENGNNQNAATEFNITMHGESYHIKVTGKGYSSHDKVPYYISVDGVPEELLLEPLDVINLSGSDSKSASSGKRPRATSPGHVTTSMPGSIVDILVKLNDKVKAGDPVLITEAMKMETEIQAPVSGEITAIYISKGESVTPEEILIEIS